MSTGAILFLLAFGFVLFVGVWRASTIKSGPEGHALLGTFTDLRSVAAVRVKLEGLGIEVVIEDHRRNRVFRGSALPPGSLSVYVPTSALQQAEKALRRTAPSGS